MRSSFFCVFLSSAATMSITTLLLLLGLVGSAFHYGRGFSVSNPTTFQQRRRRATLRTVLLLQRSTKNTDDSGSDDEEDDDDDECVSPDDPPVQSQEAPQTSSILSRFTSPVLDDPYLPLSDVLVAQIIAPSLEIAWLSARRAPQPTWLRPVFGTSRLYNAGAGSLLAPTLIHGAALATCWLGGALAAECYKREAISPARIKDDAAGGHVRWDYSKVITAIVQAGAFAVGLLILSTQADLWLEFGGRWVQLGESEETDFRLLVAAVELINDVVFEALTITAWRSLLANKQKLQSKYRRLLLTCRPGTSQKSPVQQRREVIEEVRESISCLEIYLLFRKR
jgi:hypothetical protein